MFKNLYTSMVKIGLGTIVLSIAASNFVNAQQWQNVGASANVSAGGSSYNNLVIDNVGNYYLSYYDVSVQKGSVQKFNGTSWSYVGGTAGITNSFATFNSLSINSTGTNLYYTNQGNGLEVRQFNGTSWAQLASPTTSTINYHASAVAPSGVLFTYSNLASGTVNRLVNGAWEQVGNTGFSNGASFAEMVIGSNNKIYTANVASGVRVYENTTTATASDSWNLLGGAIVDASSSGEQYTSDIAIDANNNLYVAYVSNSANSKKVNVKKFNGTTWEQMGNAYFSAGGVQHVAIAVTSVGKPYVVASRWENDNFLKNTAYQLDTATNTWSTFGGDFVSDGEATYNDLAVDNTNNYLVLAYSQDFTKVKRISLTASTTPPTTPPTNPPAAACTIVPVAVTGFNADVVAEGTGGNTADKTTHTVDAFYTFYSKDFVPTNPHSSGASATAYGGGLPTNGTLTASSLSGLTFQMGNYSSNNALVLRNNLTNTGSLAFTTPKKAEKIYVAAVRGEGGSGTSDNHNVTATIHFADGTTQNAVFQATAWWYDNGTPANVIIAGTGEVSRNTATSGWAPRNEFRGLTQANLYYNVLNIDAANQNKNITSIDFNKATTSDAAHTTAILALSICETATSTTPACNNTDPGNNPGDVGCVTFNYRGQSVTYATVRGTDGKIWLQQNLGSTKVATSLTDSDAYGDLFQWGRWDDGHQLRNSALSATAPSPNNPAGLNGGNASFYSAAYNSSSNFWSGGTTSDTWNAADSVSATATNGADPCKAMGLNWRLPTVGEIDAAMTAENISEFNSALASNLKLIPAGMKDYNGIYSPGTRLYLWSSSSSPYTGSGQHLYISGFSTLSNSASRDAGMSVRCIKEVAAGLGTVDIKKVTVGVYPNPTNGILNIKTDTPIENVTVTNLVGQRLKIQYSNNQVNLQGLPNGVYIVELIMKNGQRISKKVIKN